MLAVFYVVICLLGLYSMLIDITSEPALSDLKLKMEIIILLIKIENFFVFYMSVFLRTKSFLPRFNNFISLFDKRKYYGINTILDRSMTRKLKLRMTVIIYSCLIYLSFNMVDVVVQVPSFKTFQLFSGVIMNAVLMSISLNLYYFIDAYYYVLKACYKAIENTLETPNDTSYNHLQRLQYLQRFYLSVTSNYGKHMLGVGTLVWYIEQLLFCTLWFVHSYFYFLLMIKMGITPKYTIVFDLLVMGAIVVGMAEAVGRVQHSVSERWYALFFIFVNI